MNTERVISLLLLTGLGVGCALVISPFFSAILWAAILVFTTWPVFEWLRLHARLGRVPASAIMVLLSAVLMVLPLVLAAPGGAADAAHLRQVVQNWFADGLPTAPGWLVGTPLIGPPLAELWNRSIADLRAVLLLFEPYLGVIAEGGIAVVLAIASGVLQFVLALFIAFFFWMSGDALALLVRRLLNRVCGPYADRLITLTGDTVRGTVYGIIGTAIVQGVLTGFGLWLAGVPLAGLLGTVAGFLSVLPVGAPVIWIPAALWLLWRGHTGWGVFLLIYGVLAVSGADQVIRPYFIARGAKLPFLLTALGVLGGALAFGLLGIFLGPVLLGVGFMLVMEFARAEGVRLPAPHP